MTFTSDISRRQFFSAVATASTAIGALSASLPVFAQKATRTLRIGHQKGWLSILKARGTLEKRLAPLGVNVTWTEFNAGPVQLEALNVGAIDFGDVGEAPPSLRKPQGRHWCTPVPRCRVHVWRPSSCPKALSSKP